MTTDRTVIISDTHLGRSHCAATSAVALRPLWQDARRLIINGDVAEVHHPRWRGRAAREVMQLFDLCEQDGVDLTLLSGNHDPFLTDQRHLGLIDGSVFITHGDVLHRAIAPWSPDAVHLRNAHMHALQSLDTNVRNNLEQRLAVAQYASYQEWEQLENQAGRSSVWSMLIRPWAIAAVLWYWHRIPAIAAAFVRTHAPNARFFIFGHTHRPGIWETDQRIVINTGSFGFPGTPRAVILENDRLAFNRISYRNRAYRIEDAPIREWECGFTEESSSSLQSPDDTRPDACSFHPYHCR